MLTLTRRVGFCAGHVYRGAGLARQELETLFGPAAEPSGHGHNYVLELSVAGEINPADGMVINIKDVDAALQDLLSAVDHRMLNNALPEFHDAPPTTEKLAQALWRRLPRSIGSAEYVALRLEEHPGLYVELKGADQDMVYLTSSIEFAAAHRLHSEKLSLDENRRIYGKCNNPNGHGHNYVAEVTVCGAPDERTGTVIDLGQLRRLLAEQIEARFDHKHLNLDTEFFKDVPATAENIAVVIWRLLEKDVPKCRSDGEVKLHRVRLIETARSWFDYYGK